MLRSFSDTQIILRCLLPISSGVAGLNQSQQWLRFFRQEFTVFNFHISFHLQKCQNQATPLSFNKDLIFCTAQLISITYEVRKARPGSVEFREQVQVTFTKRLSDNGTGQGANLMVEGGGVVLVKSI